MSQKPNRSRPLNEGHSKGNTRNTNRNRGRQAPPPPKPKAPKK